MEPIQITIGYDHREAIAYSVLSHSIRRRASCPVSIMPLDLRHFNGLMTRERDPKQSTDFSFSRFLTPYLCGYRGWSLYLDCDMLFLDDIAKLWELRDEQYSIMVVKHNHIPKEDVKFLNQVQTAYQYKNWSSVVMYNNPKCKSLTPEYVNTASGLQLHQFHWLENDECIGGLPERWNHLVDYNEDRDDPANLHYTLGGPYFMDSKTPEYDELWRNELEDMLHYEGRQKRTLP